MRLAILFLIFSSCAQTIAQQIPIDRLSYDIEYKVKQATYPVADSSYKLFVGDTMRISWWHSTNYATMEDSIKIYDRLSGWVQPAQWKGINDIAGGGRAIYETDVSLPIGIYTLRIWAWRHVSSGNWVPSPAPSDEVQIEIKEKPKPGGGEPPTRPVIVDILIK